ncbi:excalibur calcium-binding domain-containing protein [Sphingomonas arantia]|uniref:Excalibur calcium-binding domain-containing protein n=1 Tax=Sphingomonas arantia TaxID=1460676 RepID=A0ABW4U0Y6_9SPHN
MATSKLPTFAVLAAASIVGGAIGYASLPSAPADADAATPIRRLAVASVTVRQRPPQPGDHWAGCNGPRAAGTAPLYRGEPGYREGLDGDRDGIACEPIP